MKKKKKLHMTDEEKEKVKKTMHRIITECLGGPGGDPDEGEKYSLSPQKIIAFLNGEPFLAFEVI